jgi:hypothetical protein
MNNLKIFYHIAAMHGWRLIVMEQLNLLARMGWKGELHYVLLASPEENGFVFRAITSAGMKPVCHKCVPNLGVYEFPTLTALKESAEASQPDHYHAYFHTKGTSQTGSWVSMMWRWQMNYDLFGQLLPGLLENKALPDNAESAGSSFITHSGFSMYSGNFWVAKNSLITKLKTIKDYQDECRPVWSGPNRPHWFYERHPAETWIGSAPHKAYSADNAKLAYWDHNLWAADVKKQERLHQFHYLS